MKKFKTSSKTYANAIAIVKKYYPNCLKLERVSLNSRNNIVGATFITTDDTRFSFDTLSPLFISRTIRFDD